MQPTPRLGDVSPPAPRPPAAVGDGRRFLDIHNVATPLAGSVPTVSPNPAPPVVWAPPSKGRSPATGKHPSAAELRVTVRSASPVAAAARTGPARNRRRASTTRCPTAGLHRPGERCGREDRSTKPASPSSSKRPTHFRTYPRDAPISLATRDLLHPPYTRLTYPNNPSASTERYHEPPRPPLMLWDFLQTP